MKYYAIPSNNSSITEKHVVEDDILFTNPLAGKRVKTENLVSWQVRNEMVSLGDTAISLHILQPPLMLGGGVVLGSQNPKCQDLPKFQFSEGGGGCSGKSEPKVPRSA